MGIVNLKKSMSAKRRGKDFWFRLKRMSSFSIFLKKSSPVEQACQGISLLSWTNFLIASNKVRCLFTLTHTS